MNKRPYGYHTLCHDKATHHANDFCHDLSTTICTHSLNYRRASPFSSCNYQSYECECARSDRPETRLDSKPSARLASTSQSDQRAIFVQGHLAGNFPCCHVIIWAYPWCPYKFVKAFITPSCHRQIQGLVSSLPTHFALEIVQFVI